MKIKKCYQCKKRINQDNISKINGINGINNQKIQKTQHISESEKKQYLIKIFWLKINLNNAIK